MRIAPPAVNHRSVAASSLNLLPSLSIRLAVRLNPYFDRLVILLRPHHCEPHPLSKYLLAISESCFQCQRSLRSVKPSFCTTHPFTQPPKSNALAYTMLLNWPDTAKSAPSCTASTSPCNACSMDQPDSEFQTAPRSVQPFSHSWWQSPYRHTLQCALNTNICD